MLFDYEPKIEKYSILDNISDEIMVIDKQFKIINVNQTFCKKYNVSKKEVIGRYCYKVTHNIHHICKLPECKCPVIDVLNTGKESCGIIHSHKGIKEENFIEFFAYPIQNNLGKLTQIVKIGRDITEQVLKSKKIKNSEENLNKILSNVSDSIFVISEDFRILYMNKKAKEEFGDNPTENLYFEVFNKYNNISFETNFMDPKTKQKKYCDYLISPISNYNGRPAFIEIIRDITVRKKTEKKISDSEEKCRNVVENIPYSIILLDKNKKISDCNAIAEMYFNHPKKDLINTYFFDLFRMDQEKINFIGEKIQNAFNFDLSEIDEFEFINEKNVNAWVEIFLSVLKIGKNKFVQIILNDITEKKLVEKIITEENERLRKLDVFKKQMTDKTSQELKTPLTTLFKASKLLLTNYKDQLDQNAIKLLEQINKDGEKSIDLVGRMVDISRIGSDKFELNIQTESLIEIIKEATDELNEKIKHKKIKLILELSEEIYSNIDRNRFLQVLKDLLIYAINNNTQNNGKIKINLTQNGEYAEISINNGQEKSQNHEIDSSNIEDFDVEFQFSKEIIKMHKGKLIFKMENKTKQLNFIIQLPIKNWKNAIFNIFVLYKTGIPLYNYTYGEKSATLDDALISGGFVGIMAILREITKGSSQIKTIDHGDRKLVFESNITKDIFFILFVKEDLAIFRKKLHELIIEFDDVYKKLVENIDKTCSDTGNWENLGKLIEKHF